MISAATHSCSSDAFLQGGGEAGALMRAHDWSPTLGDPSTWPQPLKTLVRVMLHSSQPMFTAWGPERIMLYNDAYAPLCGFRHPAIGKTFSEVWFDIMDAVGPILDRAYGGEPIHMDDITFTMHRHGYPEEAHFAFSYTPVLDEEGEVVGVFCACKETTAAVAASSSLQAEQGRLRELFQQAPGFVAILRGPDHVFEIANDSYLQMIGNSRDVIGKPVREALPETVEQGFVDLLDRVYASGEPFIGRQTPVALHRQPGAAPETRYCDFIYQPIRDSRGLITGLFVQGHDVTDAKRAETAQREGDERYRALVEHAAVGVTHAALDGRWIMMNRKACQMLGYDEGELIGKRFQDFTHPEDRHDDIALNRALDAGEIPSFRREKRYLRKDGSPIWIEATVSLVRDERGAPAYRISVYQDIHERKLAAEALADSQRRLNAVLNNASVSIFLMNERQECDYMNAAAERLTGFRLDEVRGGTLHDVIHHTRPDGSHYPLEECPIDRAFPENSRMQGEEVFVHKNGSFYPVAYTASPIRDDSAGSVVGTVVEVRDIRGEKEAQ